ncbi:urease accessory UreF family protein [Mesorhizobium sp. YR577]|uniref:urease accessory protein UreF n=1 Tax=Mesorhizobium sp. YR577 TaxID=1884373 RepID=UPI0008F3A9F2|nr:urease accessory UreF family protein [Mesorhizobium sp. YR577]SFU18950.1 urease accessory protein [Mesorhizobium sp. YR577]
MTIPARAMLLALQHGDSAFPSGGFAFSQGLEAASQLQGHLGPFDLETFIRGQIRHRWARADCVAMIRSHRLGGDLVATMELDLEIEASTPAEPLRLGSRRNGVALLTAHGRLATPQVSAYRSLVRAGRAPGHMAVVQGLAWRGIGLDEATTITVSGYQCVMALATAAVRLGIVGAIEAQAIVGRSLPLVEEIAAEDIGDDDRLSSFVPLAEIAVLLHGRSEQRLFSN